MSIVKKYDTWDFIQGEKFKSLTPHIYAPPRINVLGNLYRTEINNFTPNDYRYLANTLDIDNIKNKDIIYTHSFYAEQLFEELEKIDKEVIVITHNSDVNIDFTPPPNIIKWYAQNVNVAYPHKIESIPIGLENSRWFPEINKRSKMLTKLQQPRNYRNLVYMNFNISTAPKKRQLVYNLFKDKPWITTQMGKNGSNFDSYIDNIYNHKFVLCPEGNGIDTHRLWETLYMGSIPIVKRCHNTFYYILLPICKVDDWGEVTESFLNTQWADIQEKKRIGVFSMEQLNFSYWKEKILNTHG